MTQENKELLLKDLCARLPYGVKVEYNGEEYDVLGIAHGRLVLCKPFMSYTLNEHPLVEEVKPYLFPMSSMTEEQNDSWRNAWFPDLMSSTDINYPESEKYLALSHSKSMEWLYRHHFDVNGLIEKGLAIDATGLNIY